MFRIDPALPVQAFKTFQISAPRSTHFRKATCAEADCPHYLEGWQSVIDERADLGQKQAYYIRKQSGRRFREERNEGVTVFSFEPGQTCFASDDHLVRLDKPELYIVRDGDWRGNPTGRHRQHTRPGDWVNDFGEHQLRIAEQHERG
jgi:hypothetical protein